MRGFLFGRDGPVNRPNGIYPLLGITVSIDDPDTGGKYTIKIYQSEKVADEYGGWRHTRITLNPSSTDPAYKPIVIDAESGDEVAVIAELVAVLG